MLRVSTVWKKRSVIPAVSWGAASHILYDALMHAAQ